MSNPASSEARERLKEALLVRLGHPISNAELFEEALSHRSSGPTNYERLEYLGDSLLSFVVADELFRRRPTLAEGDLSRLRASLVRESSLAAIARELDLGDCLQLGSGELKSGGFNRDSILSDVVESLIGATYIDAGYEAARALIMRLFESRLSHLPAVTELKDPKTRLQELLQSRGLALPEYTVVDTTGQAHQLEFTVSCRVPEKDVLVTARASSRRKAEQAAAAQALEDAERWLAADNGSDD